MNRPGTIHRKVAIKIGLTKDADMDFVPLPNR
jgi:hypothetical protein